jgi:hypothetical protein
MRHGRIQLAAAVAVVAVGTAASQGIAANEFDELVDAIRDGFTYANVHSSLSPAARWADS